MKAGRGMTMLEVLIAVVILGVIVTLFAESSTLSRKLTGRSANWVQEGIVVEKTLENLRVGRSLANLRGLDSTGVDNTGQYPVRIRVVGSQPQAADCPGYPVTNLAKIRLSARRDSLGTDSVSVTTYIWAQ
jgi:prepilin-type N-terminal cleavage/methylation domain-containing protein